MDKSEMVVVSLLDYLKKYPGDYDVWDNTFDMCVTVCSPDSEEKTAYDNFVAEICDKVYMVYDGDDIEETDNPVADWYGFIEKNMEKFRNFTGRYWACEYEDDDDYIEEWIVEINNLFAGYGSWKSYGNLAIFAKTLKAD